MCQQLVVPLAARPGFFEPGDLDRIAATQLGRFGRLLDRHAARLATLRLCIDELCTEGHVRSVETPQHFVHLGRNGAAVLGVLVQRWPHMHRVVGLGASDRAILGSGRA